MGGPVQSERAGLCDGVREIVQCGLIVQRGHAIQPLEVARQVDLAAGIDTVRPGDGREIRCREAETERRILAGEIRRTGRGKLKYFRVEPGGFEIELFTCERRDDLGVRVSDHGCGNAVETQAPSQAFDGQFGRGRARFGACCGRRRCGLADIDDQLGTANVHGRRREAIHHEVAICRKRSRRAAHGADKGQPTKVDAVKRLCQARAGVQFDRQIGSACGTREGAAG